MQKCARAQSSAAETSQDAGQLLEFDRVPASSCVSAEVKKPAREVENCLRGVMLAAREQIFSVVEESRGLK